MGRKGSIITYGSFEATRLKELAEIFPDLAPALERVRNRIIDLLPLIRDSHLRSEIPRFVLTQVRAPGPDPFTRV